MEELNQHPIQPRKEASKIIHDLKTPLNIILMSSEMLERKENPSPEFLHRHLSKIKDSAHKMNEIMERIREL